MTREEIIDIVRDVAQPVTLVYPYIKRVGDRSTAIIWADGSCEYRPHRPEIPSTPAQLADIAVAKAKLAGMVGQRFSVSNGTSWRTAIRMLWAYRKGRLLA